MALVLRAGLFVCVWGCCIKLKQQQQRDMGGSVACVPHLEHIPIIPVNDQPGLVAVAEQVALHSKTCGSQPTGNVWALWSSSRKPITDLAWSPVAASTYRGEDVVEGVAAAASKRKQSQHYHVTFPCKMRQCLRSVCYTLLPVLVCNQSHDHSSWAASQEHTHNRFLACFR
jgi:hypothetical protein